MLIAIFRILQRFYRAVIFARKFVTATVFIAVTQAAHAFVERSCQIPFAISPSIKVVVDKDSQEPLCTLIEENSLPSPFINSITVFPWEKLELLKVNNEPLREIGFFLINEAKSVKYNYRPSYEDTRNNYFQKVISKQLMKKKISSDSKFYMYKSDIRIKWLKQINTDVQKESTDVFTCFDSAISENDSLTVVNWCVPKKDASKLSLVNSIISRKVK